MSNLKTKSNKEATKEQTNVLVKKMNKFCLFNNGKNKLQSNNNDDNFISEYPIKQVDEDLDLPQNGRISGGSNKSLSSTSSAFYDESEEDTNQLLLSSDSLSSKSVSSGRLSANKTPDSNDNQSLEQEKTGVLNQNPNLIPEDREFYKTIDLIRVRFLESLKSEQSKDLLAAYDQIDLDELAKPLPELAKLEQSLAVRLISRFINSNKLTTCKTNQDKEEEIKVCVESLGALLKFRHHYQLSNVLPEQFSQEFYILSGAFVFGHDRQNLPILYMRAKIHRRWSKNLDECFRRYLSWQLNILTKSDHDSTNVKKRVGCRGLEKDGSFGVCFDCADVGYSCVDMDFLRFIVNLLVMYYPTYCRYALCLDLPWLFRSVWKLVKTWLPEDAQNTVQLITSKQLVDYIHEDQIPNCIRYNEMKASEKSVKNKHTLPKNWDAIKPIEELADEINISSNEVNQFKAHVEKLRKEYEQLGAF